MSVKVRRNLAIDLVVIADSSDDEEDDPLFQVAIAAASNMDSQSMNVEENLRERIAKRMKRETSDMD
jgi:hypothetical protein